MPSLRKLANVKVSPGFTLIELLLVMTVLGVLAALGISQFPANSQRARDAVRRSDLKQYQTALEVYYNGNNQYPNTTTDLKSLCTATLGLAACPDDPKTSGNYKYVGTASSYTLYVPLEYKPAGTVQNFIIQSNGSTCTKDTPATSC